MIKQNIYPDEFLVHLYNKKTVNQHKIDHTLNDQQIKVDLISLHDSIYLLLRFNITIREE